MPTKEQFAANIKEIRESKGYTVRQVAMYGGLNPSTVSMLENAKRSIPKVETLAKLAKGLREPSNTIIELAGYKPEHPSNELTISSTPSTVSIPIYGRIAAGYPEGAKEDIDGYVKVKDELVERYGKNNLISLRVNGESMNKIVPNNAVAILAKVEASEIANGDVCAVIINGDSATLKHVFNYPDRIRFEPDSWLSDFKPFEYRHEDVENENPPIQIIGKLISVSYDFDGKNIK